MNEAGFLAIAKPDDQNRVPGSVGRAIREIDVEVVDTEDQPVPAGTVGAIRCRGPLLPTGYYKNPDLTAQAFRNGWFYPNDLAAIDEQGYVFLKGRSDDVINNEGEKFYPIEVENILLRHPDVEEAAVFGWPHRDHGEVAIAYVLSKDSSIRSKALHSFCCDHLARFKAPAWYYFLRKALPRNAMGKVEKRLLKEHFAEYLSEAGSDAAPALLRTQR